jgi:hypothetical protein
VAIAETVLESGHLEIAVIIGDAGVECRDLLVVVSGQVGRDGLVGLE